jgi:diguanylate cyclase (GGDEF)-like protein
MTLSLLLPWFPILLGVGVGGRLLGRRRGFALGLLCAMFWVVLVQASAGTGIWGEPWAATTIVLGAVAIFLIGGWAGEANAREVESSCDLQVARIPTYVGTQAEACGSDRNLDEFAAVAHRFDDWLAEHGDEADPWPGFGEFVRGALYQLCKATHVKLYRLRTEEAELVAIREPDPLVEPTRVSARQGVPGHVVTTGRSYIAGDPAQGELIRQLATGPGGPDWCFAISRGTQRLGVIVVEHLELDPVPQKAVLRATEQLISLCWCMLAEAMRSRHAGDVDPASGLLNRGSFLHVGELSTHASYAVGEPVAVAVIAIEGLRELNDSGRWELGDELIREAANQLCRKVRMDDRLARFDDSRFIWLLRRVDSELAGLIVKQTMTRLSALCEDAVRWKARIAVRCGLAGSGMEKPELRLLLCRALAQAQRARVECLPIATEVDSPEVRAG